VTADAAGLTGRAGRGLVAATAKAIGADRVLTGPGPARSWPRSTGSAPCPSPPT